MKQGKRILSVVIALFLMVGLLSVPVFADDEPEGFTLTYHLNNGGEDQTYVEENLQKGEDASQPPYFATIDEAGFSNPGYMFLDWNAAPDGSPEYGWQEGQSVYDLDVKPGENFHLYAQWSPYYLISYQPNNGDDTIPAAIMGPFAIGDPETTTFQIADAEDFGFDKEGFRFTGWNTKKDGTGTSYAPGAFVNNLTTKPGKVVPLYAQWQQMETTYRISYKPNNGSHSQVEHLYEIGEEGSEIGKFRIPNVTEQEFVASGFVYEGYLFTGWNTEEDGSGEDYLPGDEVQNLGEEGTTVNLYAQWTPNYYLVSYQPNYGDGSIPAAIEGPFPIGDEETSTFQLEDPFDLGYLNPGYRFTGWNTKQDGTGKPYAAGAYVYNLSKVSGKVVQLYAQWQKMENIYYVRYNPNFGTYEPMVKGPFEIALGEAGTFMIEDNIYINPGKTFLRWNTKPDGSGKDYYPGQYVSNLTETPNSTVDLYALWNDELSYIITYNPNYGDGSIPAALVAYPIGKNATLQTIEATGYGQAGYEFIGWNTKKDGTGTMYQDGQTVPSLSDTPGEFVPLFAQWRPYYVIAYNPNNGDTKIPSALVGPCYIGSSYKIATIESTGYKKTGYKFTGWNTKKDGTGKLYKAGQTVMNLTTKPGSFVQLYAQWTPKAANKLVVSPKKAVKLYRVKLKKAVSFTIKAKAKGKGQITFTPDKKAKKAKIVVTAKGKVTVPKYCKKGQYTIVVKGTEDANYKAPAAKKVVIVVK